MADRTIANGETLAVTTTVTEDASRTGPADLSPPPTHAETEAGNTLSIFKALAEASNVLLALAYVGGCSHLAFYYKTFGLNPLELDVSGSVISTIAMYVLYESVWPLPVLTGVIVLVAVGPRYMGRPGRASPVALICIFATLNRMAEISCNTGQAATPGRYLLPSPFSLCIRFACLVSPSRFE
jgi:hypothetical protein